MSKLRTLKDFQILDITSYENYTSSFFSLIPKLFFSVENCDGYWCLKNIIQKSLLRENDIVRRKFRR